MRLAWLVLAVGCLASNAGLPASPDMQVSYHPQAKRPYKPDEPLWSGETPCGQFPAVGQGTLRLTADSPVKPPRLLHKKNADLSALTSKTRLFVPLLAECTISVEGRVTNVRVLRSVSDEFDRIVLAELASSHYAPATLNGAPVAVCMTYTARPHP